MPTYKLVAISTLCMGIIFISKCASVVVAYACTYSDELYVYIVFISLDFHFRYRQSFFAWFSFSFFLFFSKNDGYEQERLSFNWNYQWVRSLIWFSRASAFHIHFRERQMCVACKVVGFNILFYFISPLLLDIRAILISNFTKFFFFFYFKRCRIVVC